MENENSYVVLGIHGDPEVGEERVARVRFFVKGKAIDEDIPCPKVKTFDELLDEAISVRLKELEESK